MKRIISIIIVLLIFGVCLTAQTKISKKERNRILKGFTELKQSELVIADSLINKFFQDQMNFIGIDSSLLEHMLKRGEMEFLNDTFPKDFMFINYEMIFATGDSLNSILLESETDIERYVSYWRFIEIQVVAGKTKKMPYEMIDKSIFNFSFSKDSTEFFKLTYEISPNNGNFELLERRINPLNQKE